jgi:eukaryotic-like serine/threonine-protein kinase
MTSAATQLLGRKLAGGWTVTERVPRSPAQTGGYFSQAYFVTRDDGVRAFLKALDYQRALRSPDPAGALKALTSAYVFERTLVERCRRMDRVVKGLAAGNVIVDDDQGNQVVEYLIFERADHGDVRLFLDVSRTFETAWALRTLHHIATGLLQLHGAGIAHQDVKPSNILVFTDRVSKLADLGRASTRDMSAPHEHLDIAGDPEYAPPELLYGHMVPDWNARRLGCDVYLLGGMVVFLFSRANMTALLLTELDGAFRPRPGQRPYDELLPYVQLAFDSAVRVFASDVERYAPHLTDELAVIVRELCNPDPARRGHPKERHPGGNQFSLQRYVTRLDLLARREEIRLARALA